MNKFFKVYDNARDLKMSLGHNSVAEYCIHVTDKEGNEILFVQDSDIDYVFAVAYTKLCDWLSENRGGY